MNLTSNQWILIVMGVLGVLGASTAQLTELVGPVTAHAIVTVDNLASSILAVIVAVTSGQSNLVRAVQGMPGVERIQINGQANQTLASLAVDPAEDKIEATPAAETKVAEIAKGN